MVAHLTSMPWSRTPAEEDTRPPALGAPRIALALAASMPLLYLAQRFVGDAWILALSYRPASLFDGGWWPGLITAIFVHAGWGHALMNAIFALAFGAPVARLFRGPAGVVQFVLFYLVCGVVALIGYSLAHPHSQGALIGASGAVFGLMGAGLRLLGRRDGTPRALNDRRFLVPAAIFMVFNVATGLVGLAPGMEGAQIAWEAHAFGFIFGALAVGPLVHFLRRSADSFDSPGDLRDPPP